MGRPGSLRDTCAVALRHGLFDVGDAMLVGVARRPTSRFDAAVEENYPALGPPSALLDEFERRVEDLKMRGLCEEGAHNSAWAELDFGERYRDHLDADEGAEAALAEVTNHLRGGEDVVLICDGSADGKRSHRTALREELVVRI